MKINIVTQVYNSEHRIKDWLDYHKKIGIDSIMVFDDLSTDKTLNILKEYSAKDTSVIVETSDKESKQNILFKSGNDYAGNTEIYWRLIRSYDKGLKYFKQSEDSILFVIDIDEFLVPINSDSIHDALKEKLHYERFFVPSYDMKPPAENYFIRGIPVWEQSEYTWSQQTRRSLNCGWDIRLKGGVRTHTIESFLCNYWHVHTLDVGQSHDSIPSNFRDIKEYDYDRKHSLVSWCDSKHCFLGDYLRGAAFGIDNRQILGDNSLIMLHYRDYPSHQQQNYDQKFNKIKEIMNDVYFK